MSAAFDYTIGFIIDGGRHDGFRLKLDIEGMSEDLILTNLKNRLLQCGLLQEVPIDPEDSDSEYEEPEFGPDDFGNVFRIEAPKGNTDWADLGVVFTSDYTLLDLDIDRTIIEEHDASGRLGIWKAAIRLFGKSRCRPTDISYYFQGYIGQYKKLADYAQENLDKWLGPLSDEAKRYLDMDLIVNEFMDDLDYDEESGCLFDRFSCK